MGGKDKIAGGSEAIHKYYVNRNKEAGVYACTGTLEEAQDRVIKKSCERISFGAGMDEAQARSGTVQSKPTEIAQPVAIAFEPPIQVTGVTTDLEVINASKHEAKHGDVYVSGNAGYVPYSPEGRCKGPAEAFLDYLSTISRSYEAKLNPQERVEQTKHAQDKLESDWQCVLIPSGKSS